MAENQQEQDRNEPATPFKLKEAKKRGQVAKSMEVNSLVILAIGLALFVLIGASAAQGLLHLFTKILVSAHLFNGEETSSLYWYRGTVRHLASVLWPIFGAIVLAGIAANMIQTGPIFSFFPIKPDFKRLNPVQGFKRVFSKKMLFEALKSLIKLLLFGTVIYFTLKTLLPNILMLLNVSPDAYPLVLTSHIYSLVGVLLIAVLFIALLDLAYTRWDFAKRMRMSRRELKEEVKRREGDPLIRAKLRELQREAVKRAGSLKNVSSADVLITNPTHLSIALKYDREKMAAPIISAKGAGEVALKMRRLAHEHDIMVVENKPLARELFRKSAIDDAVPNNVFPEVAKILAWVYLKQSHKYATTGKGS